MIIRLVLIAAVVGVALVLVRGPGSSRQRALQRLAALSFVLAWVVAVLTPDLVTSVAGWVGVGRGTDLLLYVLVVVVLLLAVAIRQRLSRLEGQIAVLTRELALRLPEPAVSDDNV